MAKKPLAVDWGAIKTAYLSGITLKELSVRFSVNHNTLLSRSAREKWSVPPARFNAMNEIPTEKTTPILLSLWTERALNIREKEYRISEKALNHAEQLSEDQIIRQADGIDKLAKIGRRATGLDKEESNKNAVNIAILGDFDASTCKPSFYRDREESRTGFSTLENGQDSGIVEDSTE